MATRKPVPKTKMPAPKKVTPKRITAKTPVRPRARKR